MTNTDTTAPAFRYLGTTDDVLMCGHCGRTDLTHTVVAQFLTADEVADAVSEGLDVYAANY